MQRMKGVFFTMDAAAALLIILVTTATVFSVLSVSGQSSEGMLSLYRESRDAYEISRTSAIPATINTTCDNATLSASSINLYYDGTDVVTKNITVCP